MPQLTNISFRYELYGCDLTTSHNCIAPLGMESGKIPLAAITAKHPPAEGFQDSRNWSRLNSVVREFPNGWMADISKPDHLQIDLGSTNTLTAIGIQGGYGSSAPYVTSFRVSHSMDKKTWTTRPVGKTDADKDFLGSAGGQLPDMRFFSPPFAARYVRVEPIDGNVVKSMRFELYGCLADPYSKPALTIPLSRRSVLIDEVAGYIYVCIYNEEPDKSICKRSANGRHWKSLDRNIMGVVYQSKAAGRRLYAVDRAFHRAFSDDNGDTWFTVTEREWSDQLQDVEVSSQTNIENMLPTQVPEGRYTWTTQQGDKWGVSGDGIHVMGSRSIEWTLAASWRCCGM